MIDCKSLLDDQQRQIAPKFEPATILVTASPTAGKEAAWERALGDLIRASLAFPGYLGTTVLKPESPATRTYRIITKWDSNENMRHWRESDERQQRVERLAALQAKPADVQHVTGLKTWFDLPHHAEPHAIVPPPKYKMAAIVWLAVFFAVIPMIGILRTITAELPSLVSSAIGVTASVVLMTWIVMPVLSWVFRFWLYPAPPSEQPFKGAPNEFHDRQVVEALARRVHLVDDAGEWPHGRMPTSGTERAADEFAVSDRCQAD